MCLAQTPALRAGDDLVRSGFIWQKRDGAGTDRSAYSSSPFQPKTNPAFCPPYAAVARPLKVLCLAAPFRDRRHSVSRVSGPEASASIQICPRRFC